MECDVIDGSVVECLKQPIVYSFALDKPPGYKVISSPETIHYKKLNKYVLNTILLFSEDDNHEEVNFNEETLTFSLQSFKILKNES